MAFRNATIPLGIRDELCAQGDHIAYFWETEREFNDGVEFLVTGLAAGDFCVLFGYETANERVCRTLEARGFHCELLKREKRLAILGGEPSGETLLASLGVVFREALERGSGLIRLLGNIGWGRDDWPSENDILRFEARVTGAAQQFPCVILCMYDIRSLSGQVVMHGAFETHPLTYCRNVMRENTHFVPSETFLARRDTD